MWRYTINPFECPYQATAIGKSAFFCGTFDGLTLKQVTNGVFKAASAQVFTHRAPYISFKFRH